jgi:hypothetical protein
MGCCERPLLQPCLVIEPSALVPVLERPTYLVHQRRSPRVRILGLKLPISRVGLQGKDRTDVFQRRPCDSTVHSRSFRDVPIEIINNRRCSLDTHSAQHHGHTTPTVEHPCSAKPFSEVFVDPFVAISGSGSSDRNSVSRRYCSQLSKRQRPLPQSHFPQRLFFR